MNLPIREWLNLEKKKRIKKIKVKKRMGVSCVAECVEESREEKKEMVCSRMRVDEMVVVW